MRGCDGSIKRTPRVADAYLDLAAEARGELFGGGIVRQHAELIPDDFITAVHDTNMHAHTHTRVWITWSSRQSPRVMTG